MDRSEVVDQGAKLTVRHKPIDLSSAILPDCLALPTLGEASNGR